MKNILTVLAFAATMFFGTQAVSAQQTLSQDNNRPEVIAKEQTHQLTEKLGLNGDQTRAVFRAMVSNQVALQKHVSGKDANNVSVKNDKTKIDTQLQADMKKILTDAQYAQWSKDQ